MIIITGATSFLGKNLLSEFKDKKEIICLVRKKDKNLKSRQEVVDFNNKNTLKKFINKGDIIIHILGITEGDKNEVYFVNSLITKNLVEVSKEKKISRFIYISSAIVGIKNKGQYGKSKLISEELIKRSGLNFIILRPSIIYGKGEKKFIGRLINLIKKRKIVPIIGNGKYTLKPVYINDMILLIKKSIYLNKKNKIYYVAIQKGISMDNICKTISEQMNKKIFIIHIPLFLLRLSSIFIRIFNKKFPYSEQFIRITQHEDYMSQDTEHDFNIKFTDFKQGLKEILK